jgi:hypothetical protein
MSTGSGARLRRSREVLSVGFTTGRTVTPCDMAVLEALPASYRRLTASSLHSKAKPRGQLQCPTLPRDSLRLSTMRVSKPSQPPTPTPQTHTPKGIRQKDGVPCHTGPRRPCLRTCLHFPQDVCTNCKQLTQYECSVSCSSAIRSVGLSDPLHYCHRLLHSRLILAHLNAVVPVQHREGGYRYAKPLYAGTH